MCEIPFRAYTEEPILLTAEQGYGYFPAHPGLLMHGRRYLVTQKLGFGSNSSTWLVYDTEYGYHILPPSGGPTSYFAIKFLTVAATQKLEATREIDILNATRDLCDEIREFSRCYGHFYHQGPHGTHLCFIMDAYCGCIGQFRRGTNSSNLIDSVLIRGILWHVAEQLDALYNLGIVHTDLHLDNLVFDHMNGITGMMINEPPAVVDEFDLYGIRYPYMRSQHIKAELYWLEHKSPEDIAVQLTGLGHARWIHEQSNENLFTRSIRPPEAILGAGINEQVIVWTIGCMAFELLTGRRLFISPKPGTYLTDSECLAQIVEFTGDEFSPSLLERSVFRDKYIDNTGKLLVGYPKAFPGNVEATLSQYCSCSATEAHLNTAAQFIRGCLRLDPADRIPQERLWSHPWIDMHIYR